MIISDETLRAITAVIAATYLPDDRPHALIARLKDEAGAAGWWLTNVWLKDEIERSVATVLKNRANAEHEFWSCFEAALVREDMQYEAWLDQNYAEHGQTLESPEEPF